MTIPCNPKDLPKTFGVRLERAAAVEVCLSSIFGSPTGLCRMNWELRMPVFLGYADLIY